MRVKVAFADTLLKWNKRKNKRVMPWKGEKNPYYIWLSEIILQQTRVEQGLPYFLRFKEKFPTVQHLASAKEHTVLKLWQGLGYYSRARNLHATAKVVAYGYKGKFPESVEALKKLKGVGDYTAAAIASFAFGQKHAVVDGNVIRVLARVFGITTAFDSTQGKKEFAQLAQLLIDEKQPGIYNQAIMDFGALVCTPKNPACSTCPFNTSCVAKRENKIELLPYRAKRAVIENRYFNYLIIENGKQIFIRKRTGNDIWKNLYDLPLIETDKQVKTVSKKMIASLLATQQFTVKVVSKHITQMLSHRKIHFRFIHLSLPHFANCKIDGAQKVSLKSLPRYAFAKTIHLYLLENSLL